ncbi:hypothetical protein [Actinomadura opuntiae]|uniref:hypothetical protein n=1 Tax=Actinomadura sp. OS1-43 TaxID=604315 RepID=UPI00255B0345|nr:hypothetical protein [Actinomadura sp. OS1-43]MDL4813856.1 hypothetical protein [Actinomadura sp. OS1-43]
MDDRRRRAADAAVPVERTPLHRVLTRLRVPRFMADHAAALLAAHRRPPAKRDDR